MADHAPTLPSHRQLWLCWAILMSMTAVSLWVGDPGGEAKRLPLLSVAVLLAVAGVKAVQILWVFLNLRVSTLTWKATFVAFLLVIFAIVLSCAALSLLLRR
ncbi:MAG TPA: cytochrome C oxidase subunit IV family protein [Patescibacteria group bacterium]|nr:cytochrome C oxidase subunit IV family protein [Patescibacteria group bacterium]